MFQRILLTLPLIFLLLSCKQQVDNSQQLALRYDQPAKIWESTLPLGNGRIGMMPGGGIEKEQIVLNDITMWSGSEEETGNKEAIKYLPQIRELLLKGKNLEAQKLMYDHFRSTGQGSAFGSGKDAPYGCFQMLGNLEITHHFPENRTSNNKPSTNDYTNKDLDSITSNNEIINIATNYERILSLNDAIASTKFTIDGINYTREYLASHANDILLIRISADKKESISFDVALSRPERASVHTEGSTLVMEGQLNDGYNSDRGVRFQTRLQIVNKGGSIQSDESTMKLLDANEAIIIISSSTNMIDKDYISTVERLMNEAIKKNYKELKKDHISSYREKFDRVTLNLGDQNNSLTTNNRLSDFQQSEDPAFAALYFQYGRYLMISGTNEESMPLNLQGLWANTVQTPWNGDYHLNINVQMNYWPVEVCNLSELHKPLINFTESLVPSGTKTARTFYNADGWVAHVITNPWLFTAPAEHASWGATNTGGAWLCEHLWEHYAFTQDTTYLRTIYPTLKGAGDFFLSNMIEEPTNGWLVTAPSSSPENAFYMHGSKDPVYVCMGPTMDVQIIRELFTNILSAASILGIEDETVKSIEKATPKLPPMQISDEGYLMEWLEDYEEVEPKHRHVSHLYGLYPSNQITPYSTPELADAARETLNRRGDGGTGWSRAWKVNFWARLQDGNRAFKLLKSLLEPAIEEETPNSQHKGGTYPNLFCAHPPFQIDGNFGGTSGIAEMLIQSHNGFIEILPALPDTWQKGSFTGLKVRGSAEIDAEWEEKRLKEIKVRADANNTFTIKVPDYITRVTNRGEELNITERFIKIKVTEGKEEVYNFS